MSGNNCKTCVIFGGADIEDYSALNIIEADVIIAADRGYEHCRRLGIVPDLLVGDFDSIETRLPADITVVRAPCEKDDTDLIMAVREGVKAGCGGFHIYGADGGRMGHTFANIQTLTLIASMGCDGVIHGNTADMTVQTEGKRSYKNGGYRYVSVFSLSESSAVRMDGLKYSGEYELKRYYPIGVSNEFAADECSIEVISGELLIILEKM